MTYLSSSETAKKWGITKARVITLAKEGRINGAKRAGNNWLIPEDAIKPLDKRYKKNCDNQKYEHRFSLYLFGPYPDDDFKSTLNNQERTLLEAQLDLLRCDFASCVRRILSIIDSINNIYTRIAALYTLCCSCIYTNNYELFNSSLLELEDIFSEDFPMKKDYYHVFYDIHSLYLGNDVFINKFIIEPSYDYSADILPLLILQTTYRESIISFKEKRTFLPYHLEIICNSYEQQHYYFVAQRLHIYIGILCTLISYSDSALFHFRRAIEIGVEYDSYSILASVYPYRQSYMDSILEDFDPTIKEKIQNCSKIMSDNVLAFLGSSAQYINKVLGLTPEEHQLIFYTLKKLSNKEVAEITGIPEYTIRRKYEKLLNRFDITNKRKLGEFYLNLLFNGYK